MSLARPSPSASAGPPSTTRRCVHRRRRQPQPLAHGLHALSALRSGLPARCRFRVSDPIGAALAFECLSFATGASGSEQARGEPCSGAPRRRGPVPRGPFGSRRRAVTARRRRRDSCFRGRGLRATDGGRCRGGRRSRRDVRDRRPPPVVGSPRGFADGPRRRRRGSRPGVRGVAPSEPAGRRPPTNPPPPKTSPLTPFAPQVRARWPRPRSRTRGPSRSSRSRR